MSRIRAVTFDAGGTLIEPWPSVGGVYAEVAAEFGISCSAARLNTGFATAWKSRTAFRYAREEWLEVVRHSFAGTCEVSGELFDAIYRRFEEGTAWSIFEDTRPALEQLQAAGVKLAVISNWDERLIPLLHTLGLARYFSEIVVSATIGAHKPDARIFARALAALEAEPGEVLHVGDSEREDIEGARSAGLKAVRIRRSGAAAPHEITSLTDVLHRLEE